MIDFTELSDKWREQITLGAEGDSIMEWCADNLDAAIPDWKTLDPNDESTWPEDGEVYLVSAHGEEEFCVWHDGDKWFDWAYINDCVIQYRERCSIDSPKENE